MGPRRKTAEKNPFWRGLQLCPLRQCFHRLLDSHLWRIWIFLNHLHPVKQKDVSCLPNVLWASKRKEIFFSKCYKNVPRMKTWSRLWAPGIDKRWQEGPRPPTATGPISVCVTCVNGGEGKGRGLIHSSYPSIVFFLVLFNNHNNVNFIPPVTSYQINVLVRFLSVMPSAKMGQKQKIFSR